MRQCVDDRLGMNPFLNVNRHYRNTEIGAVLLFLALSDQLRIERRITRIDHRLGSEFFVCHKIAQFLGGDVGALVLVLDGLDFGRGGLLFCHADDHSGLGGSLGLGLSLK